MLWAAWNQHKCTYMSIYPSAQAEIISGTGPPLCFGFLLARGGGGSTSTFGCFNDPKWKDFDEFWSRVLPLTMSDYSFRLPQFWKHTTVTAVRDAHWKKHHNWRRPSVQSRSFEEPSRHMWQHDYYNRYTLVRTVRNFPHAEEYGFVEAFKVNIITASIDQISLSILHLNTCLVHKHCSC